MLDIVLSKVGGEIGKRYGGGILSRIGSTAGKMLGEYLNKLWFGKKRTDQRFLNVKDSFRIAKAKCGSPIPLMFGKMRVEGKIIWSSQIMQRQNVSSTSQYFKNINTTITKEVIEFEYYINYAVAICEGEIAEIGRVWFDNQYVDLGKYNVRIYKGSEDQMPDPLIESFTQNQTPSYRGFAYIVFENLPLADFGNIIPRFSFEVFRKTNISKMRQ